MPLTSKMSEIVQAIVDLLDANKVSLGIKKVYYGDQALIPVVPSVTVESTTKEREYTSTGLQTTVVLPVTILIYHGGVKDRQSILKEAEERAEAIEDLLHQEANRQLPDAGDPRVIHSLVTRNQAGFIERGKSLFTAHRLLWEGVTKERIGV